ncbi:TAP-like protein-domain-containing protein [Aspergillus carlsbadensis]|nr:TAP-like protein-domain-containing protein [Aspergillus carlsbadensis]
MWKYNLLELALLTSSHASSLIHPINARSENIHWASCGLDDPGILCGNLTVPMDYTNPDSKATIDLQLLKVPAVRSPKKASVLFNFGGPGVEARLTLADMSQQLLALTGGHYDLIAHDPRGTANTFTASCFNTSAERKETYYHDTKNIADPEDTALIGKSWGGSKVLANACYNYPGFHQKGSMIGTAFSARDLLQIVNAIEPDGLLRYWGFSYGTVLGATVAAMFPDRIDRIVLDAVTNPHEFHNGYDVEVWADADTTFSNFIIECFKVPDRCGFSSRNSTADDIEKDIYNVLEDLKREPLVHGTTIIDPTLIRTMIRFALYGPSNFEALSIALNALLPPANITLFQAIHEQLPGSSLESLVADESPYAIHCGDKNAPQRTFEEMEEVFEALNNESRIVGSSGIVLAQICANWRISAKERYQGDFNVNTRHPMLVVGNTFDTTTPFRSAQNVSAGFTNSVLVENGGFGHGSHAHGSACTSRIIRDYFVNGSLPETTTFCETSYGPFENKTTIDVLKEIGFLDFA